MLPSGLCDVCTHVLHSPCVGPGLIMGLLLVGVCMPLVLFVLSVCGGLRSPEQGCACKRSGSVVELWGGHVLTCLSGGWSG
jgi:hypothetical protein